MSEGSVGAAVSIAHYLLCYTTSKHHYVPSVSEPDSRQHNKEVITSNSVLVMTIFFASGRMSNEQLSTMKSCLLKDYCIQLA
jgi:hypothetical protein